MSDLTEGLKVGNLRLNRVDGSVDLIELFKLEESVSDWTFVQDEEYHVYFCWTILFIIIRNWFSDLFNILAYSLIFVIFVSYNNHYQS